MRSWFWVIALCAAGVSCHQEPGQERPQVPTTPTNVVSKVDENRRLAETLVYTTNGELKHHTFFETATDGRILKARTVDASGQPKWTEIYSYGETGGSRPEEVRRIKPDGKTISVRLSYAPDGTERRIVVGPDGTQIPPEEQGAYLEE